MKKPRHGFCGTRVYRIWMGMLARCRNKGASGYKHYGARGITVCDRWNTFRLFLEDMGLPPSDGHSIDRINGNLGYFAENCRWAEIDLQANNRSNNVLITHLNITLTAAQWSKKMDIPRTTIIRRINSGKTVAEILSKELLPHAGLGKDPPIAAIRRAQTHCKRRHLLSGDNLYEVVPGKRACKTCHLETKRKFNAKLKAARAKH